MSSSGIKREVDRRTFFYCCICFTFSPRAIRVCWFIRYFFLSRSPKYFCLCFPYSIWRSLFFFSFSFHDLFRFIFQYRFFCFFMYFLFFTFPPVYLFSHTLVLFALSLFLLLFRSFFGLVFSCLSLFGHFPWPAQPKQEVRVGRAVQWERIASSSSASTTSVTQVVAAAATTVSCSQYFRVFFRAL